MAYKYQKRWGSVSNTINLKFATEFTTFHNQISKVEHRKKKNRKNVNVNTCPTAGGPLNSVSFPFILDHRPMALLLHQRTKSKFSIQKELLWNPKTALLLYF